MSFPSGPGCNCIIFSDPNLTPHFQQWQYSNCFEKSWLGFWMISVYQPPSPPTSLYSASCLSTLKCYYRRLSFTQPWAPFGIAPLLSDPPQVVFFFFFPQHGSTWTRSSVLCNQRDTYWVCWDAHQFSNNITLCLFRCIKIPCPIWRKLG